MNTKPLGQLLREAADELDAAKPDATADARTLAAMRQAHAARRPARRRRPTWLRWPVWLTIGLPAAACAAAVLVIALMPTRPADAPDTADMQASADASDFIPLVPASRWSRYLNDSEDSRGHAGTAWLVATEIPADRLALLGLPYDPAQAGRRVHAELLMHDSGEVLAVRVRP